MRYLTIGSLLLMFGTALGQEWQGPRRLSRASGTAYLHVTPGPDGKPWAGWVSSAFPNNGAYSLGRVVYSQWLGDSWSIEARIAPLQPGVSFQVRPWFAFDEAGQGVVVWDNARADRLGSIGSSFWQDTGWGPEIPVIRPRPDIPHAYGPKVSWRGGALWCVWYGGPTSNYAVYASRWDPEQEAWTPETQVSPGDGNLHWWCDIAVDAHGTPHVFWVEYPHYLLLYSYWDGEQWTGPESVNDTTEFTVSPWGDPSIEIDSEGTFHVSVTGARKGAMYRDILYTRNDGTGWEPMQMVTQSSYHEWYADIAADRPDNVWVAYNRQGEGPDEFRLYARHYNGLEWLPEERLDNDSMRAGSPGICVDHTGATWVVFSGYVFESDYYIHYNCRPCCSPGLQQRTTAAHLPLGVSVRSPGSRPVEICYELASPGPVRLEVYDKLGRLVWSAAEAHQKPGRHRVTWDGRSSSGGAVPSGVYFCRLKAAETEETNRFVLLSQ